MTSERDKNREAAPNLAALMDEFTVLFGPVKLRAGEDLETGATFGDTSTLGVDDNG